MRVFITGLSGFIGANLAIELIKQDHEVHGLIRRESKNHWRLESIKSQVKIHEGDLLDSKIVRTVINEIKPEVIYHLAVYGAYPNQKDPELILRSSVMAAWQLLQAAKMAGVKIVVSAGSSSEYGAKDHPMREIELVEPNSYYAVGKAAQTLLSQHFSNQESLPIITLRLFSVYGPYEEPGRFIPTLILNALQNKDIPLAAPDTARDFIYVDDVVRAFILASQRPELGGQIFNIGSGRQETLQTAVETVLTTTNSSARPLWNTYPRRPFDNQIWVADTTKTKNILGFSPVYSFEAGLEKTADWLKSKASHYDK